MGYFYLVQLYPNISPELIKGGFSKNLERRLRHHRTLAPNLKLLQIWTCDLSGEKKVLSSLRAKSDQKLGLEVFLIDPLKAINICEEFFK